MSEADDQAKMNEASDQAKAVEAGDQNVVTAPTSQAPASEAPAPAAPTPTTGVPATPATGVPVTPAAASRSSGWFSGVTRIVVIAAAVVVVAGGFFTIGWFTSTRGDLDRPRLWGGIERWMDMHDWDRDMPGPGRGWHQGPMGPSEHCWPGAPRSQQTPSTPQTPSTQPSTPSTQQAPSTQQGYLGVGLETVTPDLQKQYGLSRSSGALVVTLDGRGPAWTAGIRRGDIITALDGLTVTGREDAASFVAAKKAGDSVTVTIDRNGQTLTFQVTLAGRPTGFTQ